MSIIETRKTSVEFKGVSIPIAIDTRHQITAEVDDIVPGEVWSKLLLKNGETVFFMFDDTRDKVACSGGSVEKYDAALAIQRELAAAKECYRAAMRDLGATLKDEGCFEDYRAWLEIPDVPGAKFNTEGNSHW